MQGRRLDAGQAVTIWTIKTGSELAGSFFASPNKILSGDDHLQIKYYLEMVLSPNKDKLNLL